jgi:hypothetical protein
MFLEVVLLSQRRMSRSLSMQLTRKLSRVKRDAEDNIFLAIQFDDNDNF